MFQVIFGTRKRIKGWRYKYSEMLNPFRVLKDDGFIFAPAFHTGLFTFNHFVV
jgi:hypothetical protein